jgi:anti-sigma regulatory factor (Ser/Thr protein kinase)
VATRESIPAPLRLSLSGSAAVQDATAAARSFAEAGGVGEADVSRVAVVVEELVVNLYDHAGARPDDEIELEISMTAFDLRLVLTDTGKPFDPGSADNGDLPRRGGGAGLKLVRAWASQIRYDSNDGRNQLVVHLPVRRA